jgi:hypothetical protein
MDIPKVLTKISVKDARKTEKPKNKRQKED